MDSPSSSPTPETPRGHGVLYHLHHYRQSRQKPPGRRGLSPRTKAILILILLATCGVLYLVARNFSYVFARNVTGEVVSIQNPNQSSMFSGQPTNAQLFSIAVAIRDRDSGEIVTSSSEDRQWAVAKPGQCAKAKFLRYPPWKFDKAGTFFGARLLELYDCPKQ